MNDNGVVEVKMQEKIEWARTETRTAVTLILVTTLCSSVFLIPQFQELLIGGLIGSSTTALIFYFKKSEDG